MRSIRHKTGKERRWKGRRKEEIFSPSDVAHQNMLNRERVRQCRQKNKESLKVISNLLDDVSTAYQTPQALGKAVGKVRKHLPSSLRKRKAVVCRFAGMGSPLKFKKIQINKAEGNESIPDKTKKLVKEFYQLDSVSCQAPGRKDFVSVIVKDEGKKHIQKRHLFCSLKETYAMFVKDNPTVKIGLSKFCSLRPINIVLSSKLPRDVCLCSYHENIKLLCQCLNKEIPQFPVYSGSFVENFVCNSESESCMLGKCNRCPKWLHQVRNMVDIDTFSEVEWCQWERVEQMTTSKKEITKKRSKTMTKICKFGAVEKVIQSLEDQMPYFLQHVYVKRQQSAFFDAKKANLTQSEALVQVHFAENYTCKHEDGVQSAHWHQQQITLLLSQFGLTTDLKQPAKATSL